MDKQLLIYGNVAAVDSEKHRNMSVKLDGTYAFAKDINSSPLLVTEFIEATKDFAVVFSGDDEVMPLVLLGIDDNSYVSDESKWTASYTPAFLRRYPFVFASNDEGSNFTLCLDESFVGCNEENIGERLFDSEGSHTQYLKNVLEFLQTYQAHYKATQVFCKKIVELDLLEPMEASYKIREQKTGNVTGFKAISREKIKALSDEQLLELVRSDYLELIYKHLSSMANFSKMIENIAEAMPEEKAEKKELKS